MIDGGLAVLEGKRRDSFTRDDETLQRCPEVRPDIPDEMFWESMRLLPRRMLLYKTEDG